MYDELQDQKGTTKAFRKERKTCPAHSTAVVENKAALYWEPFSYAWKQGQMEVLIKAGAHLNYGSFSPAV